MNHIMDFCGLVNLFEFGDTDFWLPFNRVIYRTAKPFQCKTTSSADKFLELDKIAHLLVWFVKFHSSASYWLVLYLIPFSKPISGSKDKHLLCYIENHVLWCFTTYITADSSNRSKEKLVTPFTCRFLAWQLFYASVIWNILMLSEIIVC